MFKLALFALITVSLAGCATRPVSNSEAVDVPADRILNTKFLHPVQNSGIVTIKRDSGQLGSMCSTRVFVNSEPIADLRTSEKVIAYLPVGDYIFSAWPNGICGGGMSEVSATVKADSKLNFRVGYGSNGDFSINPTAF